MVAWITANLATIIVAIVVFGVWGLAVWYLVRSRKTGKGGCSCGGGCSGCPGSKYCHSQKQ